MSLRTYPADGQGAFPLVHFEPRHATAHDPFEPGHWVTHQRWEGKGIVIAVNDEQLTVMWSVEPDEPDFSRFQLPAIRRPIQRLVAQDLSKVQPMTLPSGMVFYLDYTYGSGSKL